MLTIAGSKSEIVFEPLPQDDPKVTKPDIKKAMQVLGWSPKINGQEGLLETFIALFQEHTKVIE